MIQTKKGVLIALIIPIVGWILLVAYKKHILSTGVEVTRPITAYDPRDLLSGHYLTYTVNYGVEDICKGVSIYYRKKTTYVCLKPPKFSLKWPNSCELVIRGVCNRGTFRAGIERYYVPKEEAKKLERLVRSNKASITFSVNKAGQAQVKDLLINGISWKKQKNLFK